jgi:hypothetical protein
MGRFILGMLGIAAALTFIFYSAVTQYWTAHGMTSQFQELAGGAAAGMVFFECMGLLFVRRCWANGSRWLAVGGLVLVLAATVYLVRLDLRFHVAGQSDLTASRDAGVENRAMAKSELTIAQKRRDDLYKVKDITRRQRDELARLEQRITSLESKLWDTETVNVGGMPEAGWASRMLSRISTDRQWWTDALMVLGLLFWALARMLALPLAVASMQSSHKPSERSTAAKDDPAPTVAQTQVPPVLEPPVRLEPVSAPDPEPKPPASAPVPAAEAPRPSEPFVPKLVETTPPTRPRSKAERLEAVDVITRKWFAASASKTSLLFGTPAKACYENYRQFCEAYGIAAVNDSHFGRSVRRLKIEAGKTAQGATYGLQLQRGGRSAARAIA